MALRSYALLNRCLLFTYLISQMRIKIDPTIQNSPTEPKQPSDPFRAKREVGGGQRSQRGPRYGRAGPHNIRWLLVRCSNLCRLWQGSGRELPPPRSRRARRRSLAPRAVQLPVSAVPGIPHRCRHKRYCEHFCPLSRRKHGFGLVRAAIHRV